MKKLILCLMLWASFKANSQVIDTTIKSITAVKVQPFVVQVNFPQKDTITHFGLELVNGDLKGTAKFRWILLARGKNTIVGENPLVIEEDEYKAWDSDLYPFVVLAKRLGLVLLNK